MSINGHARLPAPCAWVSSTGHRPLNLAAARMRIPFAGPSASATTPVAALRATCQRQRGSAANAGVEPRAFARWQCTPPAALPMRAVNNTVQRAQPCRGSALSQRSTSATVPLALAKCHSHPFAGQFRYVASDSSLNAFCTTQGQTVRSQAAAVRRRLPSRRGTAAIAMRGPSHSEDSIPHAAASTLSKRYEALRGPQSLRRHAAGARRYSQRVHAGRGDGPGPEPDTSDSLSDEGDPEVNPPASTRIHKHTTQHAVRTPSDQAIHQRYESATPGLQRIAGISACIVASWSVLWLPACCLSLHTCAREVLKPLWTCVPNTPSVLSCQISITNASYRCPASLRSLTWSASGASARIWTSCGMLQRCAAGLTAA